MIKAARAPGADRHRVLVLGVRGPATAGSATRREHIVAATLSRPQGARSPVPAPARRGIGQHGTPQGRELLAALAEAGQPTDNSFAESVGGLEKLFSAHYKITTYLRRRAHDGRGVRVVRRAVSRSSRSRPSATNASSRSAWPNGLGASRSGHMDAEERIGNPSPSRRVTVYVDGFNLYYGYGEWFGSEASRPTLAKSLLVGLIVRSPAANSPFDTKWTLPEEYPPPERCCGSPYRVDRTVTGARKRRVRTSRELRPLPPRRGRGGGAARSAIIGGFEPSVPPPK